MSVYREAAEQDWRDHDEGLYDPDLIVDRERDELRDRALERAERLRAVSGPEGMSWPTGEIYIERVRPARRPERRFTGAELGFLVCAVLLTLGWAAFLASCAWLVLG